VDNTRVNALLAGALALVVITPAPASASGRDLGGGKPYACNPQAECLARATRLQGSAAEAARRDCARMPTAGTCFAPDDTPADRGPRLDFNRPESPDRPRR
jgi:hypothetical protein